MHISSERVDGDADVLIATARAGEICDQVCVNVLHRSRRDRMATQRKSCSRARVALPASTVNTGVDVGFDVPVHGEPVVFGGDACAGTSTAGMTIALVEKFEAHLSEKSGKTHC